MKTQFVTTISLMYAFCNCEQEYNITFHVDNKTWIDAIKFCNDINGVIYSDIDDIKRRLHKISPTSDVWTGQYKAMSPWTVTWGCHEIKNFKNMFRVTHNNQTECQRLCSGTEFFAIKNGVCVCLLLNNLQKKINYSRCSCNGCYRVIRHKLSSVKSSCSDDTECLCLAAACIQNKIRLTSEVCTSPFTVRCDDNRTTVLYKEHKDAVIFCNESSSFLQWYTNDSCSITIRLAQQWTSGTRLYNTYQVARHDKLNSLPSLRCMKLDNSGETKLYAECDRETVVLPFFCKVDNIQTDLEIKENNNAGIIAGSVLPVLFIVALAVLGFFLYKKRQDSKTHQNKSLNRDPTTVMFATENKTSDHEINVRASKRPLPIPIPLAEKQDDKLNEDENTYSKIASVFFNESRNNFSNQCYNDIDFEGDNNSLAILNIENKQLGAKTEDDENYYSRIASAVFNEQ